MPPPIIEEALGAGHEGSICAPHRADGTIITARMTSTMKTHRRQQQQYVKSSRGYMCSNDVYMRKKDRIYVMCLIF